MHNNTRIQRGIVAFFVTALGLASLHLITAAPVTNDAAQNLRMAINLSHHQVISLDESQPFRPSMYREPLPIALDAIAISIFDKIHGAGESSQYLSGDRALTIKYQNCAWVCLLWLAAFSATRYLTGSFIASIIAAILVVKPLLADTYINNLTTELPAAVLLVAASLLLARGLAAQSLKLMIAAGVCFGLLTLTKATVLYIVPVLAVAWFVANRNALVVPARRLKGALCAALFLAAFAMTVTPWVVRNYSTFGTAQIAERGGLALYTRALMNRMSALEYRGTFYVWTRPSFQRYLGTLLDFRPADLELGGRLQRLNEQPGSRVDQIGLAAEDAGRPEEGIGFWRTGRAQREKLEVDFARAGNPQPEVAADRLMQNQGVRMILHEPLRDLALIGPFLWRAGPLVFVGLFGAFVYALRTRQHALMMFILPGCLLLAIYACVTDLIPRYGALPQVTAAIAIVIVLNAMRLRLGGR